MNEDFLAYLELRGRYFKDKKITDLTNEEIEEFLQLRTDFETKIKKPMLDIWNHIKEAMKEANK